MKPILFGLTLLLVLRHNAQEQNLQGESFENTKKDTSSKKHKPEQTQWQAHTRSFFMSTINESELKDDYALASGFGLGVLTKPLYRFQIGLSGYFIYNVWSSNIYNVEPSTYQANRYEIGLFDVEAKQNAMELNRLEELYLKYSYRKNSLVVGKINLNTPFLNPQDGRMRPTLAEGAWLQIKASKKMGFSGGWIWTVSPRSTVKWHSIANSIGVYPMGVNVDGSKADYNRNIVGNSGLALANLYYNLNAKTRINIWNAFLENVMNTTLVEINTELNKSKFTINTGLQYLHQNAINNGGNADQSKTYITKGEQSNVISAHLGVKHKKLNTSLNYTHITGDGRYMMPREWGKESFYTFLNRERNEGFGNLHAIMTKTSFSITSKFQTAIGYGYYRLPDVKNYRLNKYGMPSYYQINAYATYDIGGLYNGLQLRVIAAYKINAGTTYNNLKYVYNKVNMINLNLILDYNI